MEKDIFLTNINGRLTCYDFRSKRVLFHIRRFRQINDYIIYNEEGQFDCQAHAVNALYWKTDDDQLRPLSDYYNDFLYPQLLFKSFDGEAQPRLNLYYYLKIPSLGNLLKTKAAVIVRANNKNYLCFNTISPLNLGLQINKDLIQQAIDDVRNIPSLQKYQLSIPLSMVDSNAVLTRANKDEEIIETLPKIDPFFQKKQHLFNLHYTAVGINKYNSSSHLADLHSDTSLKIFESIINDNKVLLKNNFDTAYYWPFLTDTNATFSNITQRIVDVNNFAKANDLFVIYLSGHGGYPPNSELFNFYPFDAIQTRNSECLNCINTPLFVDMLKFLKIRRFILLIDACQSGAMVDGIEKVIDAKLASMYGDSLTHFSYCIVTSSTPLEISVQNTGGGFLINQLKKIIDDLIADKKRKTITFGDIVKTLRNIRREKDSFEQTPMVIFKGVDFPIFSHSEE